MRGCCPSTRSKKQVTTCVGRSISDGFSDGFNECPFLGNQMTANYNYAIIYYYQVRYDANSSFARYNLTDVDFITATSVKRIDLRTMQEYPQSCKQKNQCHQKIKWYRLLINKYYQPMKP